jgi:hypothetical protein
MARLHPGDPYRNWGTKADAWKAMPRGQRVAFTLLSAAVLVAFVAFIAFLILRSIL